MCKKAGPLLKQFAKPSFTLFAPHANFSRVPPSDSARRQGHRLL